MGGKTTKEHRARWLSKPGNANKAKVTTKRWRKRTAVKKRLREASARYRVEQGLRMLVQYARRRALKKGIEFSLPLDWTDGITTCALTGIPFVRGDKMYAASIDRIDNDAGYNPGNCRVILRGLNVFKNDGTDADMYRIALALINHRKDVQ